MSSVWLKELDLCVFDDLNVEGKRRDEMGSRKVAEHAIEAKTKQTRESPQKSQEDSIADDRTRKGMERERTVKKR